MKVVFSGRLLAGPFAVLRVLFVLGLAGLAAACASTAPKPEAANQYKLTALFAETYLRIESFHIEPIDNLRLAVGGLTSLAGEDKALSVMWINHVVMIQYNGEEIHRINLPAPNDAGFWGAETSAAVIAMVEQSQALQMLTPQELYDAVSAGFVSDLAEPSEFFPGDSVFTVLQAGTTRKFDMGYDLVADGVQVARLDPKGKLEAQGLRLGDVITDIEGTPTAGLPKVRIFELLGSGLEFGSTSLTVRRAGVPEPITLELWEASGAKYNLRVRENEGIAEYSFVDVDYESTRHLGRSLSRRPGRPFKGLTAGKEFQANGILLDLRNTPDHPDLPVFTDPSAAVRLAGFFLAGELAGSARRRYADFEEEWRTGTHAWSQGYPLVIVVDSTTSGAAEIAAAALQDAGRGLVVGASTAGDGKLHSLVALPTGGYLVTPSGLGYSPAGYPIEDRGIMPHICTSIPGLTLDGLLATLRRGQGMIPEDQRTRATPPNDQMSLAAAQRTLCPPLPDSDDLAYALAIAILRDPSLYARLTNQGAGS